MDQCMEILGCVEVILTMLENAPENEFRKIYYFHHIFFYLKAKMLLIGSGFPNLSRPEDSESNDSKKYHKHHSTRDSELIESLWCK